MVYVCFRRGRNSSSVRPAIPQLPIGEDMFAFTETKPSGTGKPESVFISWLLWQPRGADLAVEALKEVRKLARYEGAIPMSPASRRCSPRLPGRMGACTRHKDILT